MPSQLVGEVPVKQVLLVISLFIFSSQLVGEVPVKR